MVSNSASPSKAVHWRWGFRRMGHCQVKQSLNGAIRTRQTCMGVRYCVKVSISISHLRELGQSQRVDFRIDAIPWQMSNINKRDLYTFYFFAKVQAARTIVTDTHRHTNRSGHAHRYRRKYCRFS